MLTESVTPSSLEPDIASYLDFLAEVAEARRDPLKMPEEMEDFCRHHRAFGICRLSGEADVDGFFHHLIQSALTRRHYLQAAQAAGGGEPRYRRMSMLEPVFDAMAARQWRLATGLCQLMAQEWTEGEEYEDDFCYGDFLRRALSEPATDVTAPFSRWERVLDGATDHRLEVARSLAASQPEDFVAALHALLRAADEEERTIADPVDGSVLAEELPFFPNHWVSIEGLALLALAERRGIDLQGTLFSRCPPLARSGAFGPFRSLGYPFIEYVNE